MTSPQYFLAEHVFVCRSGGQMVLLDLKQDKYLALGDAQVGVLGLLVAGWPIHDVVPEHTTTTSRAMAIAESMARRGLLTTDCVAGKDASEVAIERAASALCGEDFDTQVTIRSRHVSDFFLASLRAAAALRWRSIEHVVRRVEYRKAVRGAVAPYADLERSHELVTIFNRLRPFVFTAREACLFDSLALVEFLARFDEYPFWVFGVRTHPFAAHCWVQGGDRVFNDSPEHVATYTPIMVI